ncbi:MAG: beta-ketoacyl synthase chain length factor [Chitinophagaceae bacterium]
MKIYIRSTGNISPQVTFGHPAFIQEPVSYPGNRLACIEPDYKQLIDAKLIRRMSRMIKMGVAAALECLQEAGEMMPGAIITGTSYGCLEDTGIFLSKMVEYNEELLTPTAFIQSTHNTVGAQVALVLSCHHYNNTFVHRGFSFESALLDSLMLLAEKEAGNVLVGSVDEITNISHAVLSRFGLYRQRAGPDFPFTDAASRGTIAGEGAAFFLLATEPAATDYGCIEAMTTFYKPKSIVEIEEQIVSFLDSQQLVPQDIDLVITGRNGDRNGDEVYNAVSLSIFKSNISAVYKHLCGEYPTSTSFAMWLAASIVKTGLLPPALKVQNWQQRTMKKVLVYNHFYNIHHSLLLISAC